MKRCDDSMYELICKDRFDKLEKAVLNDIPHMINGMFWRMVGLFLPFFAGIIYIVLRKF